VTRHGADIDRRAEWDNLRGRYLAPAGQRPPSTARGVHHLALLSNDVEKTIAFYQALIEFPLTELFDNRDYQGSTHFFFDTSATAACSRSSPSPVDLDAYSEVLGGLHHLAISVAPDPWKLLKTKVAASGVHCETTSGSSLSFNGPDGERLEHIRDPLGEKYGTTVL
jgi:catechol 2,3-dioxygenase-like lactoylglutathione lyase family enzyme